MPLSRFGWLPPLFLLLLLHVTFFTLTTAFQDVISISAPNENYFSRQKRSLNEPTEVSSLASSVHLNTSHLSLILSWTGVNSRYLLCISKRLRNNLPRHLPEVPSPDGNASHCTFVFTDVAHKTLFMTKDCGLNVEAQPLSFSPNVIEFDQRSRNTFLVHDTQDPERKLYVTNDFGQEFIHVQDYVQKFLLVYDAPQTHLFLQRATPGGLSNILSSKSFFLNSSDVDVVYSGVLDYEIRGSFIFVKTRDEAHSGYKELFVSQIGKDGTPGRFVRAEFGDDRPIHDYYIVDVTIDNQVLLCANFDSQLSNLYTSLRLNDYEATFSLSLPRVIFYNPSTTWNSSWLRYTSEESPFVDIVKVQGLRGVYIANQIRASYFDSKRSDIVPEDLKSLITFDLGALWSPIRKPRLDKGIRLPLNCSKKGNCSLHLSQYLSNKYPSARSIPILSRASSVGLILGSGNIGNHLGVGKSNVYLSADAGLSWQQTLAGSYYYSIGDHGGIIVAVKYYKTDGPTNELLYSINEGVTWNPLVFYKKPVRIFGLLTPPGENSTIFTMFGTEEINSVKWIIIKVDLKSVYLRNCTADDYKLWSPSDSSHGKHRNCLLGRKEVFERRVVHTNCYNGLKYDRLVKVENCHCERSDFQCDFGFIPDEASPRTCIANPQFTHMDLYEHPSTCKPGGTYRRKTGYVKIPGNTCIGGKEKEFSSLNVSCPLPSKKIKVSRINLWNMSEVQVLPLKNISDVTTLEYDLDHDCAIWSDGKKKQICIQCMNETASGPRILISEYIESVQGMALDWSSRNLYFVDGKQRKIEVVRLDNGSIRRVILDDKVLKKPRGIAVYPGHGYLYYSDWYEGGPSIGRTLLDGKGHKTLIKGNNIVWPNYLSIDFIANRIYWTDSKIGHIGSCDLHGENLKFIDSAPNMEKKHPFSVAVHKIYSKMIAAMDVKIFSKSIRSQSSGCSTNPCSHLCIPLPETSPQGFKKSSLIPQVERLVSLSLIMEQAYFAVEVAFNVQSQCNGIKDCPDGSDEMNCDDCPSHFFKCADGKCINSHWRCDGESDCDDNSDEMKCGFKECAQGFFKCDNDQCVNAKYRCDLVEDCSVSVFLRTN
ncbi:Sortilinrelated receptor_ L(DLR class) A repeatscontaininglike [Caligus rogercresseyi]|uniref:Sortilinrelated receptor_ L(DLR class) A repeatscontaininglike n=1 Tax=Caligus rogercresseyi TaxID=217165 RepID=A0A7T8GY39_CALRO|nr:Sortilinrelated receptor_ L(DLR class) A repeatscontaininglike [Caligus rogercresseyi]